VLFTAGAALLVLGLCYGLLDGLRIRKWAFPFFVFGTNAITVYVGSSFMAKMMGAVEVSSGNEAVSLKAYIYGTLLQPLFGDFIGSLLFPLMLLVVWFVILWPLYRKRIFIKI
jgi:predicted acyltransferase